MRDFLVRGLSLAVVAGTVFCSRPARGADTLSWNTNRDLVSAQIDSVPLLRLLEGVANATGWRIYVEPDATRNVSVRFSNLASGDALARLLVGVNYALVPETNSPPHLYVFHTSQAAATQAVQPTQLEAAKRAGGKIPNELIVRLKPGASIDALAKELGAKVTGRIAGLNAYRLQFADAASAEAARARLAGNSDVTEVDSNYSVSPPPAPMPVGAAAASWPQIKLNPPSETSGRLIVGLVDTAVQPLGNGLDQFLVKTFSEAGQPEPDSQTLSHGTSVFETLLRGASLAENSGTASFQVAVGDVYGPNPNTDSFTIAEAIADLVNYGAKVINISSGGPHESQVLQDVIQQGVDAGVQFYAATGNDGSRDQIDFPAADKNVTAVTAGVKPGELADYANADASVHMMAPGTALVPFGGSTWMVTGTSVASPFVAGWAAGLADSQHTTARQAAATVAGLPAFQMAAP